MSSYVSHDPRVEIFKYADDVTIVVPVFKSDFNDISLVSNEIMNFEDWCHEHQMYINVSKTKVLNVNFGRTPLLPLPMLDNVPVLKVLGLLFNEKLSWSDHFDFIGKKVSQRLYVLRVLKSFLPHDQLVLVFTALVQSLMDYASQVFMNPGYTQRAKFKIFCNRAFRIIHGPRIMNCDNCNILSPDVRRQALSLQFFKRILAHPDHILHRHVPPISKRSQRLVLPFVRTSRRANSFFFSCSLLCNQNM